MAASTYREKSSDCNSAAGSGLQRLHRLWKCMDVLSDERERQAGTTVCAYHPNSWMERKAHSVNMCPHVVLGTADTGQKN